MTLIEFYNKYFLINLLDYPNIGIDLQINVILFCFLIGLIVTTVIINLRNEAVTRLIKKLLRYESLNEENAKTLTDLGINNAITRSTLMGSSRIAKIISRVGAIQMTYEEYVEAIKDKKYKEEKIDFNTASFYISEENYEEAVSFTEADTTSPLNTALLCLLMTAIYVFLMFLMPSILSIIDGMLA